MSSFFCDACGVECCDTERGYITGCEHYPPDVLSEEQQDGLACVVCNQTASPLVPIPDIQSKFGSQLFRCLHCDCDHGALAKRVR